MCENELRDFEQKQARRPIIGYYQVMSNENPNVTVAPVVEEKTNKKADQPKRFKVLLLNDDYTPMDFVVEVLQKIFFLEYASAVQIMLDVHQKGKAVCGVYTRDIAETKVALVNDFAKQHEHPLLCKMEEN